MSTKKTPWDKENPEQEAQREASNDNDPVLQMKAQAEATGPLPQYSVQDLLEAYQLGVKVGTNYGKIKERGRVARLMKELFDD